MTDNKITFHVQQRKLVGKKVSQLRKTGVVPANVYGMNQPSLAISLDQKEVEKQLKRSESGLVYLEVADTKKTIPALIDVVERHALTTDLLHVNFKRVNLTEKVITDVELVLDGDNSVPNATVLQVMDSLEVESLPTNIPESIVIDISKLTEVGQVVTIKDLLDQTKLEIVCEEDQLDNPVVLLQEVKEEVEVDESAEPVETIIIGKGKEADEDGRDGVGESDTKDDADKNE